MVVSCEVSSKGMIGDGKGAGEMSDDVNEDNVIVGLSGDVDTDGDDEVSWGWGVLGGSVTHMMLPIWKKITKRPNKWL